MADTHADNEHLENLGQRAVEMTRDGTNKITAGKPGEPVVYQNTVGNFLVRKLPDDPDCVRVSIGLVRDSNSQGYVVVRGRFAEVQEALNRALHALHLSAGTWRGD